MFDYSAILLVICLIIQQYFWQYWWLYLFFFFLDNKKFCHPDIVPPRHCAIEYKSIHYDTQTFCNPGNLPLQSFWHLYILQPKLYSTPPSIITVVTWVQPMQAWHSANSKRRPNQNLHCAASLAAGGYNQPRGPIESLFLLSPACILYGRAQLYSSKLSYSFCILLHHQS